jgi:hypothetical protein
LAWTSIVEDVEQSRLNIDQNQLKQAEKEARAAAEVLPKATRECFKWLLCPVQDDPRAAAPKVEALPLNPSSGTAVGELERVCLDNELVIREWSPVHLRTALKDLYWKDGKSAFGAMAFWEDSQKYLYLPRLKSRDVLAAVVRTGAASRDFFGTAYGQSGDTFDGFQFGDGNVSLANTLLLIEPEAAKKYAVEQKKLTVTLPPEGDTSGSARPATDGTVAIAESGKKPIGTVQTISPKMKSFHGSVDVNATLAKSKLNTIADEIIKLLTADPNATVRVTLEIDAEFPHGAADSVRRSVSENATSLGFKAKDWE